MNTNIGIRREFSRQYMMHIFIWLGLLFLVLFYIIPMLGIVISFNDYNIKSGFGGMFSGPYVGLKHFADFIYNRKFIKLVRNTVSGV